MAAQFVASDCGVGPEPEAMPRHPFQIDPVIAASTWGWTGLGTGLGLIWLELPTPRPLAGAIVLPAPADFRSRN